MVITFVSIVGVLFVLMALESIHRHFQTRRRAKKRARQYQRYIREYESYSTSPDGSCAWCGHPNGKAHVCQERT